jgi:hypothetical protein
MGGFHLQAPETHEMSVAEFVDLSGDSPQSGMHLYIPSCCALVARNLFVCISL